MIDLFPFSGFIVGVLGLGPHGLASAHALRLSGAEVWAWDHDKDRRDLAAAEEITIVDLTTCDAREIVSLYIEPDVAHGKIEKIGKMEKTDCDPIVARVREAGGEVISDAELLARAQRDAAYMGITGIGDDGFLCSLITQIQDVAGKDVELGGVPDKPILSSHPLDLGGMYILLMPPEKLDLTVSITYDTAIWLGADRGMSEETINIMRTIFHRQTYPRTAIISVDDPISRDIFETLKTGNEQAVIPISGKNRVPGGVYFSGSILIDDVKGDAVPVTDLAMFETYDTLEKKRLAAFAYTAALSVGIEPRVAMASIQGY